MPFTFPSHPGLILPLWVAWPRRFDAVALAIGSMVPDLFDRSVDLLTWQSGHKFAHSLVGLVVVTIPLGIALTALVGPVCARLVRALRRSGAPGAERVVDRIDHGPGWIRRMQVWLDRMLARPFAGWLDRMIAGRFQGWRVVLSVALGAFSHLILDLMTHRYVYLFLPWDRPDLQPGWLPEVYAIARLPLIDLDWWIGPFEVLWIFWTIVGAVLFAWCWARGLRRESWR